MNFDGVVLVFRWINVGKKQLLALVRPLCLLAISHFDTKKSTS